MILQKTPSQGFVQAGVGSSLLGALVFGVGLFTLEIIGAASAFLNFVGLLAHSE